MDYKELIERLRKYDGLIPIAKEAAIERILSDPDTIIQLATSLKEERQRSRVLEAENQMMKPKADYFDALVDRNLLTNFRETAKPLEVKPKAFVTELLWLKYIYRDQRGKLMPYQSHVDGGLFEGKECCSEKNTWSGTQTLITPKGRETFRLLFAGIT